MTKEALLEEMRKLSEQEIAWLLGRCAELLASSVAASRSFAAHDTVHSKETMQSKQADIDVALDEIANLISDNILPLSDRPISDDGLSRETIYTREDEW